MNEGLNPLSADPQLFERQAQQDAQIAEARRLEWVIADAAKAPWLAAKTKLEKGRVHIVESHPPFLHASRGNVTATFGAGIPPFSKDKTKPLSCQWTVQNENSIYQKDVFAFGEDNLEEFVAAYNTFSNYAIEGAERQKR